MSLARNRRAAYNGEWSLSVRLLGVFAAIQLGLHGWFAVSARDPRMLMPHAVAWLQDCFVLLVFAAIVWGIGVALLRWGFPQRLWTSVCNVFIFTAGLLLASYPGLLTEFLAFPMSVFRADGATTWFFVSEYLGWNGLWPVLVSGTVAGLACRARWRPRPRRRLLVVVVLVMLLATPTLLPPAPQPFVYAVQDSVGGWLHGGRRAVPSLSRPTVGSSFDEASAVKIPPIEHVKTLRYDHVLILVFEGVTTARFEQEFLTRPKGYYARVRDRSAYFGQYHTTNLDSFTSLIAMLTSVQVPYRAYANPRLYQSVNEGPNFVAALRRRGFRTLFISTSEYQPFVPVRKDWSRIMGMRDLPQQDGWVAVGGSKVEAAAEDRAAIPAIMDFLTSHPQTLVLHEMVFGHSPRWIAKTGKRQLEYYDQYLLELLDRLEQAELGERVLLVVVSDHGDRADAANAENYHVPLLISGQGIPPSQISAHLSHRDLPGIIGHFLADQELPKPRKSLLTVGSTERWVYGEITSSGSYIFIDNDTGAVLAGHGTLDARSLFERFQGRLNGFAARYQR